MAEPKPLWEVMAEAYCEANHIPEVVKTGMMRIGCAAELRAIADAVVPSAPHPQGRPTKEWTAWRERQRIRQRLLDAAAEAGEEVSCG